MVRSAVKSWLKLPKDTPTPYFHALVVEGDLGVPLHEQVVSLMKAKHLCTLSCESAGMAKQTRRSSLDGRKISSSHDLKEALAEKLH